MKIKKILTSEAIPGMVCAGDVYALNNLLVIGMNTPLTDRIITRLQFYSVQELPIFTDLGVQDDSSSHDNVSEPAFWGTATNVERIKSTEEFKKFNHNYNEIISDFTSLLSDVAIENAAINVNDLVAKCDGILSNCRNGLHVFDMLHCIRDYDDLTYVHSLNVALICNTIGVWLKLPKDEINILTLAGLLHDTGKLLVPNELITKPGKLTDEEYKTVKTHAAKGYQVLKDKEIDKRIKYAALMHHERCDGSGYPNGFTRKNIDEFTKIVSIADVYDAMTSKRIYRGPLCPFDVINLFEVEGFQKYDPHYLFVFLEGIALSYMHNQVRLSNGSEGEIIMLNKLSLSKPVVHVGSSFIDLSRNTDLSIIAVL